MQIQHFILSLHGVVVFDMGAKRSKYSHFSFQKTNVTFNCLFVKKI